MLALLCLISVEDSFSCYLSDVLAAKYCNCGNNEEVNFPMRCDDVNRLTWRWYTVALLTSLRSTYLLLVIGRNK